MFEQDFVTGNSIFHTSHPGVKVVLSIGLILAIVLTPNLSSVVSIFLFLNLCIIIAKLPLKKVIKRLLVVNSFVVFLWFFLPFSTPGDVVFRIFGFGATLQGILQTLLITIKANSAFLVIMCFISTTPIPLLGHAFHKLKLPSKFVLLFLLTYRYIDVIFEEFTRLMNAAKVRNFYPKTNIHTYKTIAYMLAMVLIKSYERGKRVYDAMVLRGFNGKFYCLTETKISKNDLIVSYLTLFIIAISNLNYYKVCLPAYLLQLHIPF